LFSEVQNYTFKAFFFKIGGAGVFARLGAGAEMKNRTYLHRQVRRDFTIQKNLLNNNQNMSRKVW
jgi:hypothetical protein